ncbi:MAG TPA: hypothetical protein VLA98_07840, partial [Solirubrobacteraceae bacterium]|nr:hypothetical protein [Solirubrobacteraceae bacterium]
IEDPLADFVLKAELPPGGTVMVGRAPEGEEPEVTLTVVEPKKVPAGVGGREGEAEGTGEPHEPPSPAAGQADDAEPAQP